MNSHPNASPSPCRTSARAWSGPSSIATPAIKRSGAALLAAFATVMAAGALLASPGAKAQNGWTDRDMARLVVDLEKHRREIDAGVRHSRWNDTGTYVRAPDGDTLAVQTTAHGLITVRLAGVDAPERGMRHADEATQHLLAFVRGAQLSLQCKTIDKFGRHVCEVQKGDQDLGASLVGAGLAWHFKRYAQDQSPRNRELYARLEDQARARGLGIWSDRDAMAPELCRKAKREGAECR